MTTALKFAAGATLSLAAVVPSFAFAAMYAYVDQAGDVKVVDAANPNAAIASAPNIDEHSGVILLSNPSDAIVGDHVQGVQ
ncbi:MAG TPA: hypothetical protein VHD37_02420 [Candidatus Paceibacterota bacterium]|nr:hypothetical protein [Candidatus Paceibacterota bacterium]